MRCVVCDRTGMRIAGFGCCGADRNLLIAMGMDLGKAIKWRNKHPFWSHKKRKEIHIEQPIELPAKVAKNGHKMGNLIVDELGARAFCRVCHGMAFSEGAGWVGTTLERKCKHYPALWTNMNVTDEAIKDIQSSDETLLSLSTKWDINQNLVWKIKNGTWVGLKEWKR